MRKEPPIPPAAEIAPPTFVDAEHRDPLLGETLGERFRLDEVAGRGDWGVLYQALDLRRSKPVAVKVMHRDLPRQLIVGRMKAAKSYTAVRHERLGQIRAARFSGFAWIATEWMGGVSLRRMMRRHGNLPAGRTIELMMHLCRAIRPLHAAGVAHGNLKPNNVFLVPTERGDFLRLIDPGAASDHTGAEAIISPKWISPEQLDGELTQSSDVFAIGLLGYRMLTGRAPFFGATPALAQEALRACAAATVKSLVPGTPFKLIRAIERCLQPNVRKRFPGVDSLLATLSEALPDVEDEHAPTPTPGGERSVMVVRRSVIGEQETPAVPGPSAALLRAAAPDGLASESTLSSFEEIDQAIAQVMSLNGQPSLDAGHGPDGLIDTGEHDPVAGLACTVPPGFAMDGADTPHEMALPIDDDPPDLFDSIEMDASQVDELEAEAFAPGWRRALGKAVRRVRGKS